MNCYNENCINGTVDENGKITPKVLKPNKKGFYDSFYCDRRCKAKVITGMISKEGKPRTIKEIQYWLSQKAKEYRERITD